MRGCLDLASEITGAVRASRPEGPRSSSNRIGTDSMPNISIGGVHGECKDTGTGPAASDVVNHRLLGGIVAKIAAPHVIQETDGSDFQEILWKLRLRQRDVGIASLP